MSYKVTVLLILGLFAVVSYLLGSINFAIIVTKIFTGRDIRRSGSGNAGMTNVMRIVGFLPGAITLLFDIGKAILATCLGKYFMFDFLLAVYPELPSVMSSEGYAYAAAVLPIYAANICGLFCILGHLYPIYFKFKGGKGISTIAGAMAILDWRVFLIVLSIFIIVYILFRIISVSSVVAAISYPLVMFFMFKYSPAYDAITATAYSAQYRPFFVPLSAFVVLSAACFSLLTIIKHAENIKRIFKGEEKPLKIKRFTFKKKESK